MKLHVLLITFFISGCSNVNLGADNKSCLGMSEFEILQSVDDGALAYECTLFEGCSPFNQLVFLEKQRGIDYYDGLKVKVPNEKCAVQDGVYKYINRREINKTVPVIKFEYKNNPKTEEEFLERWKEEKEDIYSSCLEETLKDDSIKNKTQLCKCVTDTVEDTFFAFLKQTVDKKEEGEKIEDISKTEFIEKLETETEKKCGKLPKYLVF